VKKVILEKVVSNCSLNDLPHEFQNLDISDFGINGFKLYEYQHKAIENILHCLNIYFSNNQPDKENLLDLYKNNEMDGDLEDRLNINNEDENFDFLSDNYEVSDEKIEFKEIINRAGFWMATGSGKTLVMVKLIDILFKLIKHNQIPEKDILILAPKDRILKQIQEHIAIFNQNGKLQIEFRELRDWEKVKHNQGNLFGENSVTVFYYRADNITEQDKDKQVDYKTYLNNGNWYLILDEAHKGDSEFSKRQQYYTVLSQNGFLFNFSATFTDDIDIATTVFNFNLKKFIEAGYGKNIKITNQEYRSFRVSTNDEYNEDEKKQIVLESLILFSAIKKEAETLQSVKTNIYHNPLLVTIANSVHTIDADLKMFFAQLVEIAKGNFEIAEAKDKILSDLREDSNYLFGNNEPIDHSTLRVIQSITKKDVFRYCFNASSSGSIEVVHISGNSKELAFRLTTSEKHFCLLVAADVLKWEANVLEDYLITDTPITKSFFDSINKQNSDINILLGSRIFSEGWDSNRPNVINFINIGIDEGARKFVMQALGRGVRIQPFNNERKRFSEITNRENHFTNEEIQEINDHKQAVESLFILATKKEVVKNIVKDAEVSQDEWKTVKEVQKSDIERPLYFPVYKDANHKNDKKYKIHRDDFSNVKNLINSTSHKILAVEDEIQIRTLNKLDDVDPNFTFSGNVENGDSLNKLKSINTHFNEIPKVLHRFEIVTNEIKHFEHIQTRNRPSGELLALENEIKEQLKDDGHFSVVDMVRLHKDGKVSEQQLLDFIKKQEERDYSDFGVYFKVLYQHYYNPILLTEQNNEGEFRHIINVESEKDFLDALENYAEQENSKLNDFDWWYFSKLDESLDEVNIPYYDEIEKKFRDFSPDFVFWLKKDNNYFIVFIDPKGTVIPANAINKIDGFNELFSNDVSQGEDIIQISLWYYNPNDLGFPSKYSDYWTDDLEKVFDLV